MTNPTADTICRHLEPLGWVVTSQHSHPPSRWVLTAVHGATGERHVVSVEDDDEWSGYRAACELAGSCGVELEG